MKNRITFFLFCMPLPSLPSFFFFFHLSENGLCQRSKVFSTIFDGKLSVRGEDQDSHLLGGGGLFALLCGTGNLFYRTEGDGSEAFLRIQQQPPGSQDPFPLFGGVDQFYIFSGLEDRLQLAAELPLQMSAPLFPGSPDFPHQQQNQNRRRDILPGYHSVFLSRE